MNQRPPRLSPHRLAAGLLLPLASYLLIRALVGSSTTALLIITAIPAIWLLGLWIARRRIDLIGVVTLVTTVIALAAFALTHGDPLALKLRRGVVTGPIGITALLSVALRRPLLLLLARADGKSKPGPRGSARQPGATTLRDSADRDRRAVSGYRWPQPDRPRPNRSDRVVRGRLNRRANCSHRSRRNRHRLVHPRPEQADQRPAPAIVPRQTRGLTVARQPPRATPSSAGLTTSGTHHAGRGDRCSDDDAFASLTRREVHRHAGPWDRRRPAVRPQRPRTTGSPNGNGCACRRQPDGRDLLLWPDRHLTDPASATRVARLACISRLRRQLRRQS